MSNNQARLVRTNPGMPELSRWDGVEMDEREWVVQAVSETGALQLIAADGSAYAYDFAESVTPNGKRYELRELADHPATLTTVEDYEDAPEGTIVIHPGSAPPYLKIADGRWATTACETRLNAIDLVNGNPGDSTVTVLRWGRGEADD